MNLSIPPDIQRLIEDQITSGKYSSPEDVIAAAVITLDQKEQWSEFDAGELDTLLSEGERSTSQEGTLDGEEAFRLRRQRRAQKRSEPQ